MLDEQLARAERLTEELFSGQLDLDTLSRGFSREEMCDFLERTVSELRETVAAMSPEQLAYRLPGSPSGPDESGDEQHFDASEIVTHVVSALSFHRWQITRALGHERPTFPRPPEGAPITGKKQSGMGRGGWRGVPAEELARLLDEAAPEFLAYARSLPDDVDMSARARYGIFGNVTAHGWLFLGCVHPAMHLKQIRDMQSRPDYPRG